MTSHPQRFKIENFGLNLNLTLFLTSPKSSTNTSSESMRETLIGCPMIWKLAARIYCTRVLAFACDLFSVEVYVLLQTYPLG